MAAVCQVYESWRQNAAHARRGALTGAARPAVGGKRSAVSARPHAAAPRTTALGL